MRSHKKSLIVLGLLLSELIAFPAHAQEDDPTKLEASRIRVFGQNGVFVKFYKNSSCAGGKALTVSGSFGSAFRSFVGASSNVSIGMPDTPNVENIAKRDGLLSKAYFREYTIVPGSPVTLTMAFQSNPSSNSYIYCKKFSATFIPEPGKDYEAALDIEPGLCIPRINEIVVRDDAVELSPVNVEAAAECS